MAKQVELPVNKTFLEKDIEQVNRCYLSVCTVRYCKAITFIKLFT